MSHDRQTKSGNKRERVDEYLGDPKKERIIGDLLLLIVYLDKDPNKELARARMKEVESRIEELRKRWGIPDPIEGWFGYD